ncbi:MAG: hypothetical protein ACR2FY_00340 [Pirellulaceae bacterium]
MAKANKAELIIDRRTDRDERRKESQPIVQERRAKVQRRRQIDPTTCEREYSDDEIQFMHALDAYKRTSGRMFPTCSEILEVIRDLGYVRDTSAPGKASSPVGQIAGTTAS